MANFAAMMAVLADTGKLNLLVFVHRLGTYKLTPHSSPLLTQYGQAGSS